MSLYLKDPQARIDHAIDWSLYLAGQSIVASVWSVIPEEPNGLEVDTAAFAAARTAARLSGGIAGRLYRLTNRVTLSDGQTDERSSLFRVEER
jgi:hypothetical protein